jgi:peptidoglycan/xylan/chitin deacetylase (PgdA/CDA1 family)
MGHEIGSHGHHHCKRANIADVEFEQELVTSRAALREILGEEPRSFSYPFDSHLPGDAGICRRYFLTAATVAKRRIERDTDPMWLPRFTWPGPARNSLRMRRWLLTGTI